MGSHLQFHSSYHNLSYSSRAFDRSFLPHYPHCSVFEHVVRVDVGDPGHGEGAVDAPDVHLPVLVHHEAPVRLSQPPQPLGQAGSVDQRERLDVVQEAERVHRGVGGGQVRKLSGTAAEATVRVLASGRTVSCSVKSSGILPK